MIKLFLSLSIFLAGCTYEQGLQKTIEPDSFGAEINTSTEDKPSYEFRANWDLK